MRAIETKGGLHLEACAIAGGGTDGGCGEKYQLAICQPTYDLPKSSPTQWCIA